MVAKTKRRVRASPIDTPPKTLAALPPWLIEPAAALRERDAAGRLPHALLLRGAEGVGKRAFARWFAEVALCHSPEADGACGHCPSCRQLLAGAHPDYRKLTPEGTGIKIEAVRALLDWQRLAAPAGRWRVALLDGADTLNHHAANALLKTLEEPANGALLLLVADQAARLPATVRSRCQEIVLVAGSGAARWLTTAVLEQGHAPIDENGANALLARVGGAPFAALALADPERQKQTAAIHKAWLDLFLHRGSVGRISDSVADLPTRQCLATFDHLAALALKRRAGLPAGPDPAEQAVVSQVADRLGNAQWFTIRDRVQRLHRIDGPSFKTQAVLEGLLADIRLMLTGQVSE